MIVPKDSSPSGDSHTHYDLLVSLFKVRYSILPLYALIHILTLIPLVSISIHVTQENINGKNLAPCLYLTTTLVCFYIYNLIIVNASPKEHQDGS